MKTIRVDNETWKRLYFLKINTDVKDVGSVIKKLLNGDEKKGGEDVTKKK